MNNSKNNGSVSLSYYAWQKFKKNKLAMFGLLIIVLCFLIAVLGFSIAPDSTPDANNQMLEISKKPPGFKVQILLKRKNEQSQKTNFFSKMLFGEVSDYRYLPLSNYRFDGNDIVIKEYTSNPKHNGTIIRYNIADVVYALNYNILIENNVEKGYMVFYEFGSYKRIKKTTEELRKEIERNNIVTQKFILGTDIAGRDLLSRLIIGTRISFAVGFISVFISLLIGVFFGALAGYYRGRVDDIIMWLINVIWSVPTLLLVIAITLAIGRGFWQVFIAVGLTMWVEVARLIRGQIISLREKDFIEASKAMGYSDFRIIFRHILPNMLGAIIVISAANFAAAILIEAGLSFLGIGAQPPTASWGAMISAHRGFIIGDSPYLAFLPGFAIMIMVLAFVLFGNGLRDAIDTKVAEEEKLMY